MIIMSNSYRYIIESNTLANAEFFKHIIVSHGFLYEWEIVENRSLERNCIAIIVELTNPINHSKSDFCNRINRSEFYIGFSNSLLGHYSIAVELKKTSSNDKWGILSSSSANICAKCSSTPVRSNYFRGLLAYSEQWKEISLLLVKNEEPRTISISRTMNNKTVTFFHADLIEYLTRMMLGPSSGNFEEWSDVYSTDQFQSLVSSPIIDNFLNNLFIIIGDTIPSAFQQVVDYYPYGKTAPVIFTGDSDDVNKYQLVEYYNKLSAVGIVPTILIRNETCYKYSKAIIQNGSCSLGIHPYSETGLVPDYNIDFKFLCSKIRIDERKEIIGLRNHHFQWVGKETEWNLCREWNVIFNLNCITAGYNTWIGSGSGVGFPIAFPPIKNIFSDIPLHLPTIIEDDVFIFDHEYCYKYHKDGDSATSDTVIQFLNNWVLKWRKPATVNFHPEHTQINNSWLLDIVIDWCSQNNIWTPSLEEFRQWLIHRRECIITVTNENHIQNECEIYRAKVHERKCDHLRCNEEFK
jgi:hypothetical protein